jgi:predicted MFS family arabinose efflux permease
MRARGYTTLVLGLGGAQLLAWGTLYYAVAVVGEPMRRELEMSASALFGAFAWSTLLSGVLAPAVGRALDRLGGRTILAASILVGALGYAVLAFARSWPTLTLGWSINGVAMALGLYETCFATIAQAAPHAYRRLVTGVTLVAGFASTVAWPTAHYLLEALGWRVTCLVFAGALLLCLPVYLTVLPAGSRFPHQPRPWFRTARLPLVLRRNARWLSLAFAGSSLIAASMSVHLVSTLEALRFSPEHAVWLAASIGALQVLGRVLDFASSAPQNAIQLGFVTFAGLAAAMLCLLGARAVPALVYVFIPLYGIANGLVTIAKAALPAELFGLENIGTLLGDFAAPSLVTRAVAPLAYATVVSQAGYQGALLGLVLIGLATLASYAFTTRAVRVHAAPLDVR